MKKVTLIASMLALSMLYTACKKVDRFVDPDDTKTTHKLNENAVDTAKVQGRCDSMVVDLMAGQHTDIGSIVVKSDTSHVYVTFNTTGGWVINETHLYVGPLSSMPQTATGNPKIGNFPYKASHTLGTTTYTYAIARSELSGDSCISIVPHAATQLVGEKGEILRGETAWGAGTQLNKSGSWAMYNLYCFCKQTEGDNEDHGTGRVEGK